MEIIKIAEEKTIDLLLQMGSGDLLAQVNYLYEHGLPQVLRQANVSIPLVSSRNLEDQLMFALNFAANHGGSNLAIGDFAELALNLYKDEIRKATAEHVGTSKLPIASTKKLMAEPASLGNSAARPQNGQPFTSMVKPLEEKRTDSEQKSDKPNASVIAKEVVQTNYFAIYQNGIYLFMNGRYKLVTEIDIKRLLNERYRNEAERYGFAKFYDQIIDFVYCEQRLLVDNKAFEATTYLVAFQNGYLDTRNWMFHNLDPRLFFTSNLLLNFDDSDCDCPRFDRFLSQIARGNALLIARIYEVIGLALSNDMGAKALFCFSGVTNSAKSTLIKLIASFFDEELVTALSVQEMDKSFAMGDLIGKAICADTELPATPLRTTSVAKLKQLTSLDKVNTDIKYRARVSFSCVAKIFLATNHPFQLDYRDDAFLKRVVAIPFYHEIPKRECNPDVLRLFEKEKLAIAIKSLRYYCDLRARGYVFSGNFGINDVFADHEMKRSDVQMLSERDEVIRAFVEQSCSFVEMEECTATADLHAAYKKFCEQANTFSVDQRTLTSILKEMLGNRISPTKRRVQPGENPKNVFAGIRLQNTRTIERKDV